MSKWLADEVGLVEGERAIYIDEMGRVRFLRGVTVVEVLDVGGYIRVKCAEFDEYVLLRDIYTKEKILEMLEG